MSETKPSGSSKKKIKELKDFFFNKKQKTKPDKDMSQAPVATCSEPSVSYDADHSEDDESLSSSSSESSEALEMDEDAAKLMKMLNISAKSLAEEDGVIEEESEAEGEEKAEKEQKKSKKAKSRRSNDLEKLKAQVEALIQQSEAQKRSKKEKKKNSSSKREKKLLSITEAPQKSTIITGKAVVSNDVRNFNSLNDDLQRPIITTVVHTRTHNEDDGLKWHVDRHSPPGNELLSQWYDAFKPLVPPIHLANFTDIVCHQFDQPVDYLISWTDRHTCCGFVRNEVDATENVPLVMRFGGFWTDKAVHSMYIGCTVRVRRYVKMKVKGTSGYLTPGRITPRGLEYTAYLFAGIPISSAFAIEWAVVDKPRIVRTLGTLVKDLTQESKGTLLVGDVKDCEYGDVYPAAMEKWPVPDIKKLPQVPAPVILNYVEIKQPHVLFKGRDRSLLMPSYMENDMPTSPVSENSYVFAWIDLSLTPSRTFEE
ncbi:unnamed protein product [Bursaphelenchus okinawaensis]|uniref:Uncharacterized protein n=1 Tax=Bursaphelenchus okinawaensis TaxID=465554 RepID=A0A811LMQ0_9BILA|nr:unnamed protein product [Bursaphelenchus okinawaensis]CAG9127229.1 unnamed protein product [Bursaphelenchus okinawaensis]